MGFDLNALATKNATTTVEFMGQSASVLYNPSLLTQENVNKAKTDEGFVDFFTSLVKDWDLKRGTKKVPISLKGLETVPMPLLRAIYVSIMSDGQGDVEEGKASSDG